MVVKIVQGRRRVRGRRSIRKKIKENAKRKTREEETTVRLEDINCTLVWGC